MTIRRFGDTALIATVADAAAVAAVLQADPFWLSVVPTGSMVLVSFPPGEYRHARRTLARRIATTAPASPARTIEVPVRYDGPDLETVAAAWGMNVDEAVRLHIDRDHRVLFLGFLPGFAYIESNLPPVDRLATPRRVPAGSVAVSGTRTGLYPRDSPGGWLVIGHTAAPLFDVSHSPPALLAPGDIVRFRRTF